MSKKNLVMLAILDGYGIAPSSNGNAISVANTKTMDYLMKNSFTVSIIADKSNHKILTLEGEEEDDRANRRISYEKRYYTIYDIESGAPLAYYRYTSLAPQYLFSEYNGSLYFLKRTLDSVKGERYYLCKLLI